MAKFGPNSAPKDDLLPAGEYLLAVVYIERKLARDSGNPYLNLKWKVVDGEYKNRHFYDMAGLDTSKKGAVVFWSRLLAAVGAGEIELDSDAEISDAILNRPIKARTKTEVSGEYKNVRIERILDMTPTERETANEWAADNIDALPF